MAPLAKKVPDPWVRVRIRLGLQLGLGFGSDYG